MKCLAHATVLAALCFAVGACGQKGPLVLPDVQAKHKHTVPPLSSPVKPQKPATAPAPSPSPASAPDTPPGPPAAAPTPPTPAALNGVAAAALTAPR